MPTLFKFCLICSGYFKYHPERQHCCKLDMDSTVKLCQYNIVYVEERATVIFYCIYCSRTVKSDQKVVCKVRGNPYKEELQIPRPYFCESLTCEWHPGFQDIFCSNHPNFKQAIIVDYGSHIFDKNFKCSLCNATATVFDFAPYCNENTTIENLATYLAKYPLQHYKRTLNTPNLVWDIQTFKVKVRVVI